MKHTNRPYRTNPDIVKLHIGLFLLLTILAIIIKLVYEGTVTLFDTWFGINRNELGGLLTVVFAIILLIKNKK